jgi:hypothetical protein
MPRLTFRRGARAQIIVESRASGNTGHLARWVFWQNAAIDFALHHLSVGRQAESTASTGSLGGKESSGTICLGEFGVAADAKGMSQ